MIYIQNRNEKIKKELLSLALEIILPYRLTGPTGPTGITGPTGFTGPIITTNSMFANNTLGGPISVVLGGTNIPLSNNQSLGNFTVNATNDIYTIPVTGRYYLTYQINTTTSLLAGTRLLLNSSTPLPGSIFSPALSTSNYNNLITNLIAGNTISLQLFGVLSIVNLVGGGSTGASLTIIRID
ncbi:BclA C-terminal domain-containing protein [Bacillus wiedmannii]|uniref:BclA C-terminal domain-containing protein n=1 Tax=Bacillus wiedmannii TaxID=1890302 RepID=UPI0034D6FB83